MLALPRLARRIAGVTDRPRTLRQGLWSLAEARLPVVLRIHHGHLRVRLDDALALTRRAEDIGSAAVFVSLANRAVIWGLALYDIFR